MATNVLQVGGWFLLTTLIARALGPERKGVFDLYTTTASLLMTFLSMSITSGIVYVTASTSVNLSRLTGHVFLFAIAQGVVGFVGMQLVKSTAMGRAVMPAASGEWAPLLIGALVMALALSSMLRAVLSGLRLFITANHVDLAKQCVGIAVTATALLLARIHGTSLVIAVFLAHVVTALIAAAAYCWSIPRHVPVSTSASGLRASFTYSTTAHAGTIVQFLNYRLDVFFVSALAGSTAVGIYQTAVMLAQSLSLLPNAVQGLLFPTVASQSRDHRATVLLLAQATRLLTLVNLAGGLLWATIAPWAIPLAFGESFAGSVSALMWLLPGAVAFATNTVLAGFFAGIGKPRLNVLAAVVGLAFTVPLDLVLIPVWGIDGAAIASSVSYVASSTATAVLFVRETGLGIGSLFILKREDLVLVGRLAARSTELLRSAGP